MSLVDSSALLAYLQGEPGADVVEQQLEAGSACSAVNWSETAQKVLARGANWDLARGLLLSYGLTVEVVLAEDAERAAHMWTRGSGLSLADRLCIATAVRLGVVVWTADGQWGSSDQVKQIR